MLLDAPNTPNQPAGQPATAAPVRKVPDSAVILTRTNILLFTLVVAMGALILAQLCIVTLLLISPDLRERVYGIPAATPAPTRAAPQAILPRPKVVWSRAGEPLAVLLPHLLYPRPML